MVSEAPSKFPDITFRMFGGKSISQFLDTFSDCSFEAKIKLLDLFLKNTNADCKQVWNSLQEATNSENFKVRINRLFSFENGFSRDQSLIRSCHIWHSF